MSQLSLASVGSIGYALGCLRPIDQLEALSEKPESLAALRAKGVMYFSEANKTPVELAVEAASQTLAQSNAMPSEIEAVIYASTSFWEKSFYSERDVAWLMNKLGLVNAYPVGIFLPGCANAITSLRIAINMIRAEGCRRILVVTTDKASPSDSSKRIMWPDVSVLSDAAASCIVTSSGDAEFDVVGVGSYSAPHMWDLDNKGNLAAFLLETVRGAQKMAKFALLTSDLTPGTVNRLITNNYNHAVMKMIAWKCGFNEDQIFLDNVSRFAHAYAADTLINLHDCLAEQPASSGDSFLLLGTGQKNWASAVLRKN
ncbi:3-oxoacyl-[acyl-carrier-protein] synthase III C-terminal domain-containing protein [Polynucleobacter sp.]|jgi:3-oxoacyl-[acyl-carrier-protein] synthase-3|uniref:3-oxoacyl-[acyl-carrier-protein] synthase III C-terminal domain-containing protein n=1 Tax=Polynucleobacter sp. TaxID=2029855 RepID=UPI0037C5D14F